MSVRIFITGGTFDKEYDEITGELYFQDTHMGEILELGRSRLKVKITTLIQHQLSHFNIFRYSLAAIF